VSIVPTQNYLPNLFLNGSRDGPEAEGRKEGKTGEGKNFNFLWIVTSPLGDGVADLFSTPNWFSDF